MNSFATKLIGIFSACPLASDNIVILISFSTGLFEHPNVGIVTERKGIIETEFFKINF